MLAGSEFCDASSVETKWGKKNPDSDSPTFHIQMSESEMRSPAIGDSG
jgi:hypothetical protein